MSSLRKLRRSIAHANMVRAGIKRVNKSFFAWKWREYDQPPLEVQRRAEGHLKEAEKKRALRAKRRGGKGK